MDQDHIDALLERYLALLHEYTALRERLSRCSSDVYHNIARANFSAERGLRYGRDQYDERMQATRRLRVTRTDEQGPEKLRFGVVDCAEEGSRATGDDQNKVQDERDGDPETGGKEESEEEDVEAAKPVNPLRWFGLFAPQPLRAAQASSLQAVDDVIPRLVTVNAEMAAVEIEVRRARKKRAKAADKKPVDHDGSAPDAQSTPVAAS